VHKTSMQHFYDLFPEFRFCPCCKLRQCVRTESRYQVLYISCIFEAKFFMTLVVGPSEIKNSAVVDKRRNPPTT